MARRTSVNPLRASVSAMNNDTKSIAPPSTAAQLVEQHSHSIAQNQPHSRAAFSQLLVELRECPTAIDADVQSNYKLISVIAEAGFDALTREDPFSKKQLIDVPEIIACLDVIAIAVQRSPEVLFHAGQDGEVEGSELCLWILPKLFWLLNYNDAGVKEQAHNLFAVFSSVLKDSNKLHPKLVMMIQLYQICIDDLMCAIEKYLCESMNETKVEVNLLSSEARSVIVTAGRQPVALRRGSQVQVSQIGHAVAITLALLDALSELFKPAGIQASHLAFPGSRLQIWIVKSAVRLQKALSSSLPRLEQEEQYEICTKALAFISRFTHHLKEDSACPVILQKAGDVLLKCLATSLLASQAVTDLYSQNQFIRGLNLIIYLSEKFTSIREQARVVLLRIVSRPNENVSSNVSISEELRSIIDLTRNKLSVDLLSPIERRTSLTTSIRSNELIESKQPTREPSQNHVTSEHRPRKRVKHSQEPDRDSAESDSGTGLLRSFCRLLHWDEADLTGLDKSVKQNFHELSDLQKSKLFEYLIRIPCAGVEVPLSKDISKPVIYICGSCRPSTAQSVTNDGTKWESKHWKSFYQILNALIESVAVQASHDYRVMVMLAVKTLTLHTSVSEHRDLAVSSTGKWCLQALRSTSRELRVVAATTLPAFLLETNGFETGMCRNNRVLALDFLRQLSDADDSKLHETTILAQGQAALVCDEEEKNIILLRLVEFLGHTNTLVCGLANLELRNLAQASSVTLQELLRPFWRTIGITVVKDLVTRPQKIQQLSDMLGVSVNQLLVSTQAGTLPYLVLWRRTDILQRLASINEKGSVWTICMQKHTLPRILSLLLVQQPSQIEAVVADVLRQASPEFRDVHVANLLKSDVLSVACEVLKAAGDGDEDSRANALAGFREFTTIVERKSKGSSKQSELMATFFEKHALGMMATFSEAIDSQNESVLEKKRSLRAIAQMIEVAQGNIRIALPQVQACLQSALEIDSLRDQAFVSWTILLGALPIEEDLENLVDLTFTAIVQHWDALSPSTQQCAYEAVVKLLNQHGNFVQNDVALLPSLQSIPLMSKFESQLSKLRDRMETSQRLSSFSSRCRDENTAIVLQALRELCSYLPTVQSWIHISAAAEQPNPSIAVLVRSLLDTCVRYNELQGEILQLCGKCLGIIGCLDGNRIEANREKSEKVVMLSNFGQAHEAIEFVSFLLEAVLVNAFHSVSNPRAQGFLAYVMQELLKFCGFNKDAVLAVRPRASQMDDTSQRWMKMSESARSTLTPFLGSRYVLKALAPRDQSELSHPIFKPEMHHGTWLRTLVFDLLQRPKGDNAKMIFTVLSRIIRGYNVSIASFLLPFAVTNIILGGTTTEVEDVTHELLSVLRCSTRDVPPDIVSNIKLCSQNAFEVLDYLSKWLQEKKKLAAAVRHLAARSANKRPDLEEEVDIAQIKCVEGVLSSIPADIISKRAVECGSYARALFHWEQYIRQQREQMEKYQIGRSQGDNQQTEKKPVEKQYVGQQRDFPNSEPLYQHLHEIYSQIDEPDGLAGIASCLHVLSADQQILEFRNAGRWAAAQTWYELRLKSEPGNLDLQLDLLECLQQAGQHSMVLDRAKIADDLIRPNNRILSVTSEAAWCADRWDDLQQMLSSTAMPGVSDFNVGIGLAMLALRDQSSDRFSTVITTLRSSISKSLSAASTDSLQACHGQLLRLHALCELEMLAGFESQATGKSASLQTCLNQRLDVVGASLSDKQYLLSIRRAAMDLSQLDFSSGDIASSWMSSAKLARKGNLTDIAYNAVLQASQLGDESAKMEQARLLWKDGKHRKAIQSLESAIISNAFAPHVGTIESAATSMSNAPNQDGASTRQKEQNLLVARAHLLLAKWLDVAGQTQSSIINERYQLALKHFIRWEKGSYHLGKFYNKLLDTEKALPLSKQNAHYLSGDSAKLVIENYLRSMQFGCKYLFHTLPKMLTLWLDFGAEARNVLSKEIPDDVRRQVTERRPKMLETINNQVRKIVERIPAYLFYTALAQMVTRISHPEQEVYTILASIIVKVVAAFPQQGLWPLLALMKSSSSDRASRGMALLNKVKEKGKSIRNEGQSVNPRNLVNQGQKLSDQLLRACEVDLKGSSSTVSLAKDLGFNGKVVPCGLVIPLEKTLTASLPTTTGVAHHKAFPATRDAITISSFIDDVLVLNSLQRPRKLTVRGSDGRKYGILIKPKDDLRKDQRLMEFNTFVNRSLRKDAESSKRRLFIKTYAVTPLNEECGLIEWVDGLKPLRDIIGTLYKSKNIKVDYNLLKQLLDEACATPDGHRIFSNQILSMYKPVLHEWFTEHFPDPESWFAARLRYTRSCAVTSVLGHALGLGDRHGENVLLEEKDGGVFHVDFNCLFEKGLTFDKPERIPFRLTHNMVDAFGAYGVEGPFRRSAECAMGVMRNNEDALLTILETFVYDPTADFMGPGPRRKVKGVPETPKEMLESVKSKMRGLMRGESVPLSVEGHVDALVRQATDPANLCAMYIGWCPFL